jgi:hypothetical protein
MKQSMWHASERSAYGVLVAKLRHSWEDNIKNLSERNIRGGMDRVILAWDRDQWWVPVKMVVP